MDYSNRKRGGKGPLQWEQSYRLIDVVRSNPSITAEELQLEGASIGIEISTRTAFRFLERFRATKGDIVKSFRPHLQVVASVMREADPEQFLTANAIQEKALELGRSLHLSTVYRILHRLVATGTAVQTEIKGSTFYSWKREAKPHGHVKCIMCGRTVEFQKDYLDGLAKNICSSFDFEFQGFELTLLAKCKHCQRFPDDD
jgi:Fe2+ or Zn2+ uptake regulation protein